MKSDEARKLFRSGANCAQAVVCAFRDECGLSSEQAMRLSSSFGAGMGRLREVCGAVTGMFLVSGMVEGPENADSKALKDQQYKRVQALAKAFKAQTGSLICRELLGLPAGPNSPVSEPRTADYYARRPCEAMVALAAEILEQHLSQIKTDLPNSTTCSLTQEEGVHHE
jgi:C_GCAxxG_C_C family probable redox protein